MLEYVKYTTLKTALNIFITQDPEWKGPSPGSSLSIDPSAKGDTDSRASAPRFLPEQRRGAEERVPGIGYPRPPGRLGRRV